MEIRAPSRVLAWGSELSAHASPLPWAQQAHSGTFSDDACDFRCCPGCMGWSPPGGFFQLPNIESVLSTALLHPWSSKLVCPDKTFCLACLPSFRPGCWLRGSGQALVLNFPNFRSGVRPAAPPPAPPLPLTPQGCLICKSGSLCKFWGRGVRWAGLRTLV